MTSDDELLTTAEVARRLGVKPATVYAYASRGLLTSRRDRSARGSLFVLAEVDRLVAGRVATRRPAGVMESVTTRLTLLEDDDLSYRGLRVAELAGVRSSDAVAALLWTGDLDGDAGLVADPDAVARARPVVAALGDDARLTDRLRVAVVALAPGDPWRFDLSPGTVRRSGGALLRGLVETVAPGAPPGGDDGPRAALPALLWPLLATAPSVDGPPTDGDLATLDAALVLLADHGLAVSTMTARVAASARAHVYAVVSAALGALDGPAHGTASTAAHRFLAAALDDPAAALAERLRTGGSVPGFGHAVYRHRDPRVAPLLQRLRGTVVADVVDEVISRVAERTGDFPNVDLALAAMSHAHGMRPDAGETVFAVARTVGWVAHALEEYAEPGLRFRTQGTYSGPRPR